MRHAGYFEGTLQLRNPTTEISEYAVDQIYKAGETIAKTVEHANGTDYYVSSQKFLRQLGRMLVKKFPGVLKSTRKLFSFRHLTSKNIYRVNVMFRFVDIKRGKMVTVREKEYKIVHIAHGDVTLQDPHSGKKIRKTIEEIEKVYR